MDMIHEGSALLSALIVVVFSQPLVQCYKMLRERGGMFNLQISETWLRRYQVIEH